MAKGRALILCHNEPERGSYFRMARFGQFLAEDGWEVELCVSAKHAKYRARRHPPTVSSADGHGTMALVETPHATLFHDRQEGWGVIDILWRLVEVIRFRPRLVIMASHKPSCILPALVARLLGSRVLYDWVDWWTGPGGIFDRVVIPSEAFRSMAMPIRCWRRLGYFLEGFLEWLAPRISHQTIIITQDLLDHPASRGSLSTDSPVIISGAPLKEIHPADKLESRRNLGLPDSAPEVVWLGYLSGFHGAEQLLLEALCHAIGQGSDLRLLIAGAPLSTLTAVQASVLQNRIVHRGRLPFSEVEAFLGASDLLLLPLTAEPYDRGRYPHKLGDYLASGRPSLLTPVGEAARRMQQVGLGDMVAPGTTAGQYGDLIHRWACDPGKWIDGGQRAREAAERSWDWDQIRQQFLGTVDGLIQT
jgi:glycosyltransferase involved in cell wall biosynthesis